MNKNLFLVLIFSIGTYGIYYSQDNSKKEFIANVESDLKEIDQFYSAMSPSLADCEKQNSEKIKKRLSYSCTYYDGNGDIQIKKVYGIDGGYWRGYCERNPLEDSCKKWPPPPLVDEE